MYASERMFQETGIVAFGGSPCATAQGTNTFEISLFIDEALRIHSAPPNMPAAGEGQHRAYVLPVPGTLREWPRLGVNR